MTTTSRRTDIDAVREALGGEYDILEQIGRGGMAVVYRARELELDREVAIKVLPAQFVFDESFVERFQREGRIAAQLEHPHVVPIYRVGRVDDVVYIAMKLLRGQSLSQRVRERGRLSASDVRRILIETASALGYAARRSVVHRDIKPDNIMLDEDGRCIVTDFGIARSASESQLTATGMSIGTPRYMSPEQARAAPLDGRSDIYSLGVVGYECLAGTTPFTGEDAYAILMAHINQPVPRPALNTAEEREVFAVIERMLAKQPNQRYQTADEIVAALEGRGVRARAPQANADGDAAATVLSPGAGSSNGAKPREPSDSGGPQSSAALDRALEVGIDLLKQQKPRLDAGLRALRAQPVVSAGVASGHGALARQAARARGAAVALVPIYKRVANHTALRKKQFWGMATAACLGVASLNYATHFALNHRSRCPEVPGASQEGMTGPAAADGEASTGQPAVFSVLVDDVRDHRRGKDLQLYYDVCGLEPGVGYTASVTVTKKESGLRRILGSSVEPVTRTFDETAGGSAERHHETVDFGEMPSGSYSIYLAVVDSSGRRREGASAFEVQDR